MSDELLIVGRGPSVYQHDWSTLDMPVMAVSSGVFALPDTVMPAHFATMDEPKFFLDSLSSGVEIAWESDKQCRYWPFWREHQIAKHVIDDRNRHGKYRNFPGDVVDMVPPEFRPMFMRAMAGKIHEFGFQPGWADFPSVRGWALVRDNGPNWHSDGPLGVSRLNNSLLFAIQVATQLGYRRLHFVGVDLHEKHYKDLVIIMQRWHEASASIGCEWFNLSPTSKLSEFVPALEATCAPSR